MFHPSTQRFIDDWSRRRGDLPAPRRADFSPAALGRLMPQLFMLGEDDGLRLVGGLLVDLYARDLRGSCFTALWRGGDAVKAAAALEEVRTTLQPVVLTAGAHTAEGFETRMEIVLAPLTGPDGRIERILGLCQPISSVTRLGGQPVETLTLRGVQRADGAPSEFDLSWTAEPAPRRAHPGLKLVVLDGRRVA